MLKNAIQYLVGLKDNKIYEINGDTYSDKELYRIAPHVDRPYELSVNGLDSIVKLVLNELDMVDNPPVYIRVESHRKVLVFTGLDDMMCRDSLYKAVCDAPEWTPGWSAQETTIIQLRSMFLPTEDTDYLLNLLSTISKEDGVNSEDNGVSQTVTARTGVALKQSVVVRPRVKLCPFRTFAEVAQPKSEFILRLDNDGRVGIIEADGGIWKLEAKQNIVDYFNSALHEVIQSGRVVVMM